MSRLVSDEISSESWTAREGLFDEKDFLSLDKAYTNFYGEESGEGGEEQREAKQPPANDKADNKQKRRFVGQSSQALSCTHASRRAMSLLQ